MNRETVLTIGLVLTGAVIVPVLLILSANNIFTLTLKVLVAALFLLLLLRRLFAPKPESKLNHSAENRTDEEGD